MLFPNGKYPLNLNDPRWKAAVTLNFITDAMRIVIPQMRQA